MKRSLFFCTVVCCLFLFSKLAHAETYFYYLPYYTSLNGYGTGVALKNIDLTTSGAAALVDVYDNNGNLLTTESKWIQSAGQTAFIAGGGLNKEGWMMVSSTSPLAGLCFFGKGGSDNYIADISLISDLSVVLIEPHVAQNETWDTTIMVCNPHNTDNLVTLAYADASGEILYFEDYPIQAYGSIQCNLSELVQGASYANGSVEIYADEGVAAFALYKNTKTGAYSYAGISAVDPTVDTKTITIDDLAGEYELTGMSILFEDGETITQDDFFIFDGSMQISQNGATGQVFNLDGNQSGVTAILTVINNKTLLIESTSMTYFAELFYKNEILITTVYSEMDGLAFSEADIWQKTSSVSVQSLNQSINKTIASQEGRLGIVGASIGSHLDK